VERLTADVLVAGGGLAGLTAARAAREQGADVVVLLGSAGASNWVSGINAALGDSPGDDPEGMSGDILRAGGYLNNPRIVTQIARSAGTEVRRYAAEGVEFAMRDGHFERRRGAGSSRPRTVFNKSVVGVDLLRHLRAELGAAPGVRLIADAFLVDLNLREAAAGGLALSKRDGSWLQIDAAAVVLATGGAGKLFSASTNQPGSRGMGYGTALAAGAELIDVEFVAYEPFVLQNPASLRGRSLPTTVMNEGGTLRNGRGDPLIGDGGMPGKDLVSRAMAREVAEGRGTPSGCMVYDVSTVPAEIIARYPKIVRSVRTAGTARLEVMPSQHYFTGGVRTDENGASTVPGLFAVGEVAGGAHGAHRLAGGSGAELITMGPVAGAAAARYAAAHTPSPGLRAEPKPALLPVAPRSPGHALLERMQTALSGGVGIIRDEAGLSAAARDLAGIAAELSSSAEDSYLQRALTVATAVVGAATRRTESRGEHYRADFPERDDEHWLGSLRIRQVGRQLDYQYIHAAEGDPS
jgi:aspartate oxidase